LSIDNLLLRHPHLHVLNRTLDPLPGYLHGAASLDSIGGGIFNEKLAVAGIQKRAFLGGTEQAGTFELIPDMIRLGRADDAHGAFRIFDFLGKRIENDQRGSDQNDD